MAVLHAANPLDPAPKLVQANGLDVQKEDVGPLQNCTIVPLLEPRGQGRQSPFQSEVKGVRLRLYQ